MDIAVTWFDEMPERSVVSWIVMVNGYFRTGKVVQAGPVRDTAAWNWNTNTRWFLTVSVW